MSDDHFVPRAPRFKVADTSGLKVTIRRTEEGDQPLLDAELLDVSQHGTKIRVPVNLRFEEALQIQIQVPGKELEYHGIASVRHIRAIDEEHWIVGCAIAPPLTDETFSFLATTAGKERRRFRRLNIAAEATVRRQGQTEGIPAALHNLSSGGFCFSTTDHYEVEEHVQLTLEDNDGKTRVIEARICWQVDSPDGSIAGCQFMSSESYADLCACLTEQPVLAAGPHVAVERTSNLVLTAAVLAMFVPPMMTLMMQANKVSAKDAESPAAELIVDDHPETSDESSVIAEASILDEELLTALAAESQQLAAEEPSSEGIADQPVDEPADVALEPSASTNEITEVSDEAPAETIATETVTTETVATDEPAQLREWVDNTGKYRTLATLVEVTDEHVVLLKPDGKESKVPWRRLSEADQEFARSQAN